MILSLLTSQLSSTYATAGTYTKIEASFDLPQVQGNPFDDLTNDVQVTFTAPDETQIKLPAFFDGGHTWRVRHTPDAAGQYSIVSVTLNGADANPGNLSQQRSSSPDRPRRDSFESILRITGGSPLTTDRLLPVGYDLAWHQNGSAPMPPLVESLARMGKAGVNWSRIWMNYWDGKNLDWSLNHRDQPPAGELDLSVARTWDSIVDAASSNGVYFQMTLQHHGQFTLHPDSNWAINPWNKANGGWLEKPADFFTDPKAIALTKAKYRYIIARWGYSPAIMAWELFNEVESTDGFRTNPESVSAWHTEMASFLRNADPYHHLITTSSRVEEPRLWLATDYYQSHAYPSDILTAIAHLDGEHLPKPYFLGEFGGPDTNPASNPAEVLHRGLWASLMSQSSGAAQYWFWYEVEPRDLLYHYTAAQQFITLTHFPSRQNLKPIQADIETSQQGLLEFGPGLDWANTKQTRFIVTSRGLAEGAGGMSAFLQGRGGNHAMFPLATFEVDYPSTGNFEVHTDQFTARGAKLELSLDGQPAVSLILDPLPTDDHTSARPAARDGNIHTNATLSISVPAGKHLIKMENTGADWIHINHFKLTPYAPALGVIGKGNDESAVLWIYCRDEPDSSPAAGKISISGLAAGTYQLTWWDTYKGQIVKTETATTGVTNALTFETPTIAKDLALFIIRHHAGQ